LKVNDEEAVKMEISIKTYFFCLRKEVK
jgi:hypothetical protein